MAIGTHEQDVANYIISPSRDGWSVSRNADRLSDHERLEDAQERARWLTQLDLRAGRPAVLVDLSGNGPAVRRVRAAASRQL